jgi:hypothetical protein
MESDSTLPRSHEPATGTYPEPNEPSTHIPTLISLRPIQYYPLIYEYRL